MIKIKFVDFWENNTGSKRFISWLKKYYPVEESESPDILFYSVFGNNSRKYNCKKVFFTWENYPHYRHIDFDGYDYAISHYHVADQRHYWMPSWGWKLMNVEEIRERILIKRTDAEIESILDSKSKFCCFVVSNPICQKRNNFFIKLNSIKAVDSAGKHLNNLGVYAPREWLEYMKWMSKYKFIISFENSSTPGYSTEKHLWPLINNTVPIYWGDNLLPLHFNSSSYVNVHDYNSDDEVIEKVLYLDSNRDEYRKILSYDKLIKNQIPSNFNFISFRKWLDAGPFKGTI